MKQGILIFSVFAMLLTACASNHTLFTDGQSSYSIVLGPDASSSERWSAGELQSWLKEISGAELPIVGIDGGSRGQRIIIGYNSLTGSLSGEARPEAEDESFTYLNKGGDILIWGGSERGTQYGVFSFLENELGCRWYTSKANLIPHMGSWSFSKLCDRESPGIPVRNTYYLDAFDPIWSARNKNNGSLNASGASDALSDGPAAPGQGVGYWGCHTMGMYVPAYAYFDEHPEYFSEIDGKRLKEHTQLCLSNPEVLELCIEGIRKTMRNRPDYLIYDMSQNDELNPCQCEKCRALKEQYGGSESGIMLWFVNQVADAVRDEFPDKYVGTFAYQYTRTPPTGIVPRDNVVIRLCSIECCFLHPFDDPDCPDNVAFMNDLRGWSAIAPNLYVWDYVTTFKQYLATFPNTYTLQRNVQILRDNNAIGIMEQGNYQSPGSPFAELKQYLLSKILWNPECDVQAIIDDFIDGYYGSAAPFVRAYFDLENSLRGKDMHMGCFNDCHHPIFDDNVIEKSIAILEKALVECADDADACSRARLLLASPYYMYCVRHPKDAKASGRYGTLQEIIEEWDICNISEWGGYTRPGDFYWYIETGCYEEN